VAFIARIFVKLAITQYIFVGICTDFFLRHLKSRNFEPMLLLSLSKVWGFHSTKFDETHIFSTAILLDLLCRISLELVKTCYKYENKYIYASKVKCECHCADFHETRVW